MYRISKIVHVTDSSKLLYNTLNLYIEAWQNAILHNNITILYNIHRLATIVPLLFPLHLLTLDLISFHYVLTIARTRNKPISAIINQRRELILVNINDLILSFIVFRRSSSMSSPRLPIEYWTKYLTHQVLWEISGYDKIIYVEMSDERESIYCWEPPFSRFSNKWHKWLEYRSYFIHRNYFADQDMISNITKIFVLQLKG